MSVVQMYITAAMFGEVRHYLAHYHPCRLYSHIVIHPISRLSGLFYQHFFYRAELEEKDALLETEMVEGLDSKQVNLPDQKLRF